MSEANNTDEPDEDAEIIPAAVMSYADEEFADIVSVLRNRGLIESNEIVTEMTLSVKAEEPIKVTEFQTEVPDNNE